MKNLLDSVSSKTNIIVELAKLLNSPVLMLRIGELQMELADLKIAYSALQTENMELKANNSKKLIIRFPFPKLAFILILSMLITALDVTMGIDTVFTLYT